MTATPSRPVPHPPVMAEQLKAWKAAARKWEKRARAHRESAQLATASRDHWRERTVQAERRHAIAQSELMTVRAILVAAKVARATPTPPDTAVPSCPGCQGPWCEAWTWDCAPWCPIAATDAQEAEADRRARATGPDARVLRRLPTATETALWVRVTGQAWPMDGDHPAPVAVRYVSPRRRLRSLSRHTNAADARAAALSTPTEGNFA